MNKTTRLNSEGLSETPLHWCFPYERDSVSRYRRYGCACILPLVDPFYTRSSQAYVTIKRILQQHTEAIIVQFVNVHEAFTHSTTKEGAIEDVLPPWLSPREWNQGPFLLAFRGRTMEGIKFDIDYSLQETWRRLIRKVCVMK